MIGWLVRKRLDAYEREFDYDIGYLRDIYAASPRAFWRFSKFLGLSTYREDAPNDAWYAAKLVGTLAEDCGPCTQLVVTMAERAGVNGTVLRAILAGDEAMMSADAALGYRFARAVLSRAVVLGDRLREEIVSRWGQKAVISLAFAVASARVFPTVKYALGHGKTCVRVRVGGADTLLQRQETSR
jgi:hypothetical protein